MSTTDYKFKLDIFEGPLDLLLHLIRQNEMEISEISISKITTQYLDALRLLEQLDLEVAGDYLVIAATLLNIKLRSLLPASEEEIQEEQEEELDNFLTARQLLQRLVEYRRFKEAGQALGRKAERQEQIFVRDVALPALQQAQADDVVRGDLNVLLEAFQRVIRFIDRKGYHQVRNEEYHLDDKITMFRRRLVLEPRIALSEIFGDCREKLEMIVTVIAILELCRLKELRVRQNDHFGDVFLFRIDSAPEDELEPETPGDDTGKKRSRRERKLASAVALERIEAEIIASRTGIVDDGELPMDEEERLLAQLDAEARAEAEAGGAAHRAPGFIDPLAAGAATAAAEDAGDEADDADEAVMDEALATDAASAEPEAALEHETGEAPLAEVIDATEPLQPEPQPEVQPDDEPIDASEEGAGEPIEATTEDMAEVAELVELDAQAPHTENGVGPDLTAELVEHDPADGAFDADASASATLAPEETPTELGAYFDGLAESAPQETQPDEPRPSAQIIEFVADDDAADVDLSDSAPPEPEFAAAPRPPVDVDADNDDDGDHPASSGTAIIHSIDAPDADDDDAQPPTPPAGQP